MDVRRIGKELDRLVEHVFEELKRLVGRTEDLFEDAPCLFHLEFVIACGASNAQLRISRQRRRSMPRQLDLGDHIDVSRLGISNDIPDLILRIKPLNRPPVALENRRINALMTLWPLRPDLGQLRIFLDLDPPTLIVRQMPVKLVEFVLRQQIDVLFDERNRHEMA